MNWEWRARSWPLCGGRERDARAERVAEREAAAAGTAAEREAAERAAEREPANVMEAAVERTSGRGCWC